MKFKQSGVGWSILCLAVMQCIRVTLLTTYSVHYLQTFISGSDPSSKTCEHWRNTSTNLYATCWNRTMLNSTFQGVKYDNHMYIRVFGTIERLMSCN